MGKIKCGLCSYGMSGRVFHGPLIDAHPKFELLAVHERKQNNADGSHTGIRTYRKLEKLLNDSDLDLIVVNVPDHLHFEFSKAALEAGKHVVVEKPFTMNVKEGQELISLAKKLKLGLFVFQNRRWDSDFLTIQNIIESGKLGRVVEFEAHFDSFRPDPPTGTWKEDEKLGPGLLYNLGAHLIDQALVLFGWPDAVYADIQKLRKNTGIIDYFNLSLYYPKKTAILRSSYLVRHEAAKYIIHGDQGSFIKSGADPQEEHLNQGWKADNPELGIEAQENWGKLYSTSNIPQGEIIESFPGNYMKFYDGVYDELNGKSNAAVGAEEGLSVIKIIEAAIESNKIGRKINTRI